MSRDEPDCRTCAHYHVTHQPAAPHGCRAFGFRSATWPATVVRQSSGAPCAAHEPRPGPGRPA